MSKLVEVSHVSLGGEVGSVDWAFPYLDDQHEQYATRILNGADALLLGRKTYEGLSAAYLAMPSSPFVDRMNSISKYVATRTLRDLGWNARRIEGDVAGFVSDLKRRLTGNIVKYGNGQLDVPLMENGLIDEFHLLLTPVAAGGGQHLFERINGAPHLNLLRLEQFRSGVVLLVYSPATIELSETEPDGAT
ncbi:MAG: dihydrofolate reductase family protein [Acidimicrobiales bacterium]